jgi:hypothetical protein
MAALSAARNVLLLDSRLRGNDEANGLFWFKNREFNPIRTVLGYSPLSNSKQQHEKGATFLFFIS